jgi:hypothetical protein
LKPNLFCKTSRSNPVPPKAEGAEEEVAPEEPSSSSEEEDAELEMDLDALPEMKVSELPISGIKTERFQVRTFLCRNPQKHRTP